MGYMTIVSFLNDGFDVMRNDPKRVVENIINGATDYRKKHTVNSYSVGNFVNPMAVAKSFHADCPNVFLAGQNSLTMLTDYSTDSISDMEFQLQGIKDAKQLLKQAEKRLEKYLCEIKKYKTGVKVKSKNSGIDLYEKTYLSDNVFTIVNDDLPEAIVLETEDKHFWVLNKAKIVTDFDIIED